MTEKPKYIFLPSEHEEQCALVSWFRMQYPRLSKSLFAIPNGGLRNLKIAKKLKAEGVMAGVADLFLMVAASGFHGLFIEMKIQNGGQQSPSQKDFEQAALAQGYLYILAHGCADAQEQIKAYLVGKMKSKGDPQC